MPDHYLLAEPLSPIIGFSHVHHALLQMRRLLLLPSIASFLALSAGAQIPNTLLHSIPPPAGGGVQTGAQLGYSVAVDEASGLAVAGAPYDDIGRPNSGVVKIFDSATGDLLHVLVNPTPAENDNFGVSVAISGTRVVIGASGDDTGATSAGTAYVYDLASATPAVPVVILNNPGPAAGEYFGHSVAISGTRVVAGAYADDTGANDAGSAYVYDLTSAAPAVPLATLNNPGPAASDYFGYSVAISGTRIVVGAYQNDTGASNAGSAYIYDPASPTPTVPVAILNNPEPAVNDRFGWSVAISGTRVVIGAFLDDSGATDTGSAYVYDLASATPIVPAATLNNPGAATGDNFGISAAIDGVNVVIGVPGDDSPLTDKATPTSSAPIRPIMTATASAMPGN